jgi:hypothetical protein
MFQYEILEISITEDNILLCPLEIDAIPSGIVKMLNLFEDDVLLKSDSLDSFSFLQGKISGNKLFNSAKSNLSKDLDSFFVSNHPKYMGTDLIYTYLKSILETDAYFVFISGYLQQGWLNSKVSKNHLIDCITELVKLTKFNEPIKFFVVEILDSTRFRIVQHNPGVNKIRWAVKKI